MSVFLPEQIRAMREAADRTDQPIEAFAAKWQELHENAAQVAELAGLAAEKYTGDLAAFPARLSEQARSRIALAWRGVEDIDAMMQPGPTALRTITARGQQATAPALALWREFHAARGAVLALVEAAADNASDQSKAA